MPAREAFAMLTIDSAKALGMIISPAAGSWQSRRSLRDHLNHLQSNRCKPLFPLIYAISSSGARCLIAGKQVLKTTNWSISILLL
jgi:hypothetical protein